MIEPEIARDVTLVSVAGRRWSSPVAALVDAIRGYDWSAAPRQNAA